MTETVTLYAQHFASLGLQIVPLYGPAFGQSGVGICRCRDGVDCPAPCKHPKDRWKGMPSRLPTKYENYAIVLDRFVVIDVDDRTVLDSLEETMGFGLPATWAVDTGKGRHYWFEAPEPLATRIGAWHKVDLKSGNTYVVGAGSRSITGAIYQPINTLPIAPAPDELVAACGKPRTFTGSAITPRIPSSTSTHSLDWLETLCERIRSTSTRNNELLRVTCEAIRSGVIGPDGIAMLADAARSAGLSDREISRTQASAYRMVSEG